MKRVRAIQAVGPQEQGTEGYLEKQEVWACWRARHRMERQDKRLGRGCGQTAETFDNHISNPDQIV